MDHSILLYPTIDSIGDTKSGRLTHFFIKFLLYPVLALAYLFNSILSSERKEQLIKAYLLLNGNECLDSVVRSATNLLDPYCVRAVTMMASEELVQVLEPKLNIIEANASNLSMFYSESDPWAPVDRYHKLRRKFENFQDKLDIRLCLGQMEHAFILESDSVCKVSQLTCDVIKNKWKL